MTQIALTAHCPNATYVCRIITNLSYKCDSGIFRKRKRQSRLCRIIITNKPKYREKYFTAQCTSTIHTRALRWVFAGLTSAFQVRAGVSECRDVRPFLYVPFLRLTGRKKRPCAWGRMSFDVPPTRRPPGLQYFSLSLPPEIPFRFIVHDDGAARLFI